MLAQPNTVKSDAKTHEGLVKNQESNSPVQKEQLMNLKLNADASNFEECKDEVKSELDSHSHSNSEPCDKSVADGDVASEIMLKKTSSQS